MGILFSLISRQVYIFQDRCRLLTSLELSAKLGATDFAVLDRAEVLRVYFSLRTFGLMFYVCLLCADVHGNEITYENKGSWSGIWKEKGRDCNDASTLFPSKMVTGSQVIRSDQHVRLDIFLI